MFAKIHFGLFAKYAFALSALMLGQALPAQAACGPATLLDCEYESDLNFPVIKEFRATLTDPARGNYKLPIMIQYPVGAQGPRPVVLYNHGGGANANGRNGTPEWGELWAHAGYVVIHPSRSPIGIPTAGQLRECKQNGVLPIACPSFFGHSLYGPQNTDFIISRFTRIAAQHPDLAGLLDSTKVIVAGWSGGSTIALANSGAWRQFTPGGPKYNQKSTAPIAFFGISTMGPDYAGYDGGFQSTSYDSIDSRPFLTITGKGDTHGKPSEPRTTAFLRSAAGDKYLSYDTNLTAVHGTMNLSECSGAVRTVHCRWMKSVGLAYLDSVARNRTEAIDWLASDNYLTLTGGVIELLRR